MEKISIKNLKKYYGNKLILDIKDLSIYKGDRVGVVGSNGSGKSTLFKVINGETDYQGQVRVVKNLGYLDQLGSRLVKPIAREASRAFSLGDNLDLDNLSGGERTRYELASILYPKKDFLLLDEPTNNLDIQGIEDLVSYLESMDSYMVISHNRNFLNRVCNMILEIDGGYAKVYKGNYKDYSKLKIWKYLGRKTYIKTIDRKEKR